MDFLNNYNPADDQEEAQKQSFAQFLQAFGDFAYDRDNLVGHLTVSCWIMNQDFTKVLMVHHNLYNSWVWIGGHTDKNQNLLDVAYKETKEETGLSEMKLVFPSPIDLEVLVVNDHYKRGKFVPRHLHYNVVFAFKSHDSLPIKCKPDENSGVQWISVKDIEKLCHCDDALPYYQRIMKKIKKIS